MESDCWRSLLLRLLNASRTQLLNLHRGEWDDEMLALFGIPRAALPEIKPSSGLFGHTKDWPPFRTVFRSCR
ncbi:hypothetical protein KPZU09_31430 [Klebsiella pneumoniae]|uniref:Carbohydrate kinase FGGY N-terminal domain-containing protein n=1 Tax=Klebsiella pneumoniae TaxID=573 RepID=A0A919HTF9_KLEPN|nr:hypothetical protein KPZU09_31430 [Klebsiella pneumoniae]